MAKYLRGVFLDIGNYVHTTNSILSRYLLRIRYGPLIVLFALASVYVGRFTRREPTKEHSRQARALLFALALVRSRVRFYATLFTNRSSDPDQRSRPGLFTRA
jgi:hypothetical protein